MSKTDEATDRTSGGEGTGTVDRWALRLVLRLARAMATDRSRGGEDMATVDRWLLRPVLRLARAILMSGAVYGVAPIIEATFRFLRKHPAVLLTAAYGFTSMLGFVYMRALYGAFGLNIMDFVDVSALFLAALKRPAIVSGAIAVAAGYLLAELIPFPGGRGALKRMAALLPGDSGRRILASYRTLQVISLAALVSLVGPAASHAQGLLDAKRILSGEVPTVVVEFNRAIDSQTASRLEQVTMLGTTANFAFFYDRGSKVTHVIPVANIHELRVVPDEQAQPLPTAGAPPP